MEKSASFPAYNLGTTLSAQCYLGIEPLLQRAASTGDAELLLTLLKNGVSPNFQFDDNLGPLHLAAKNGNTQCAFYLLQFNANANMISKRGVAPLHLAARHGHPHVVRMLLDHRADPNLTSKGGVNALHLASRCGHTNVVELLLDKGATIDARTHTGLTALHLASECGHTGVVCALLDHNRNSVYNSKASIDTLESATSDKDKTLNVNSWTTVENFTALHVAAHSGHVELLELLLSKYKADVDHRSKHGCTSLHLAALKGNKQCAESLVKYGADTEARTSAGFSPLHLAVLQMSQEMADFLLRLEVDTNVRDHQGRTPLHLVIEGPFGEVGSAVSSPGHSCSYDVCQQHSDSPQRPQQCKQHPNPFCHHDRYMYLSSVGTERQSEGDKSRLAECLLNNGADPNATDMRGKSPLHLAVALKYEQVVETLLSKGADPNLRDDKNESTPLHVACHDSHTGAQSAKLASLLLSSGAKVDATDLDGHTPLHFCCLNGLQDATKILMENGADLEKRSALGYTPLHVTAHYDRVGVAKILLEAGVNLDEEDFQGFTALHHAAQLPTKTMANILLLFGTDRTRVARNGHTAQSIARQLGRPAVLGALKRSGRIDANQPLED